MFSENHKVQMQDFLRKKLLNSDDGGAFISTGTR
jgi:hypothetical protein